MVCRLCQIWPKYHYDTLMGILKASVEFLAPGGQLGICWVSPSTLVSPTVQMYNWVSPAQRGAVHQTPHVSSPPFRPFAQTNKRTGCDFATIVPTQFLNPMEKGLRWRIPWARSMPFIAFIEVSTYSHTKDISLFWISTLKWRIEITFPCPAGASRGCSALRLSC